MLVHNIHHILGPFSGQRPDKAAASIAVGAGREMDEEEGSEKPRSRKSRARRLSYVDHRDEAKRAAAEKATQGNEDNVLNDVSYLCKLPCRFESIFSVSVHTRVLRLLWVSSMILKSWFLLIGNTRNGDCSCQEEQGCSEKTFVICRGWERCKKSIFQVMPAESSPTDLWAVSAFHILTWSFCSPKWRQNWLMHKSTVSMTRRKTGLQSAIRSNQKQTALWPHHSPQNSPRPKWAFYDT